MTPTTSQRQLHTREGVWEGSQRQTREATNRNRIKGGVAWASWLFTVKPNVIKGLSRRCGAVARKVTGLIPGGLDRCPGCSAYQNGRSQGRSDSTYRKVWADGREVSRGHSSSGISKAMKGQTQNGTSTSVFSNAAIRAASSERRLSGRFRR